MRNTFATHPKTVEALERTKRNRLKREAAEEMYEALKAVQAYYGDSEVFSFSAAVNAALAKADGGRQ